MQTTGLVYLNLLVRRAHTSGAREILESFFVSGQEQTIAGVIEAEVTRIRGMTLRSFKRESGAGRSV